MRIYLGSGPNIKDGFINCDARPFPGVDHVFYVGRDPFPFKDNSVDMILAESFCEHLGWSDTEDYFMNMMDECFRVLKPMGFLDISVPHFPSPSSIMHPEHRRFFITETFSFFHVPADGIDPHGYLKGFWHVCVDEHLTNKDMIHVRLWPNKPGGKYDYKEIRLRNEITEKGEYEKQSTGRIG